MHTITAARFTTLLQTVGVVRDVRVQQAVDAMSLVFDRPVTIEGVVFDHPLILRGATFKSHVLIGRSRFAGVDHCALDLRFARIHESMQLADLESTRQHVQIWLACDGIRVRGDLRIDGPIGGAISLETARIDGSIFIGQPDPAPNTTDSSDGASDDAGEVRVSPTTDQPVTRVRGHLRADGIHVGGMFDLGGAQLEGSALLNGARIARDLILAPSGKSFHCVSRRTLIAGDLRLDRARVGGAVDLSGIDCRGRVSAHDAVVGGDFSASAIVLANGTSPGGSIGLDLVPAYIGDGLTATGLRAAIVFLRGAIIEGGPVISESQRQLSHVTLVSTDAAAIEGDVDPEAGNRYAEETEPCPAACDLRDMKVTKAVRLSMLGVNLWMSENLRYLWSARHGSADDRTTSLKNCWLRRDSEHWSLRRAGRTEPLGCRTTIDGSMRMDSATVDGVLELGACSISADLRLDYAMLGSDLVAHQGVPEQASGGGTREAGRARMECRSLVLVGATVAGDVRIAHVDVGAPEGPFGPIPGRVRTNPAMIDLSGATVRGVVELVDRLDEDAVLRALEMGDSYGLLAIGARLGSLRLSGSSFRFSESQSDPLVQDRQFILAMDDGSKKPALGLFLVRVLEAVGSASAAVRDVFRPRRDATLVACSQVRTKNNIAFVSLERSRIDHLRVKDPLPIVNVKDFEVGSLDCGDQMGVAGAVRLLRSSHPFDKGVYRRLERMCEESGDHATARQIHVAMRRRDRAIFEEPPSGWCGVARRQSTAVTPSGNPASKESDPPSDGESRAEHVEVGEGSTHGVSKKKPSKARARRSWRIEELDDIPAPCREWRSQGAPSRAIAALFDVSVAYGTSPARPFALLVAIFGSLLWMFMIPGNIELSEAGRAALVFDSMQQWKVAMVAEPGVGRAVRMSLRAMIPLVPLSNDGSWEASQTANWGGLSPHTWVVIVRLLTAVLVPLNLLALAGFWRRD